MKVNEWIKRRAKDLELCNLSRNEALGQATEEFRAKQIARHIPVAPAQTNEEMAERIAHHMQRATPENTQKLLEVARTVVEVLSAPRDRLGRLDMAASQATFDAREKLRLLAVEYQIGGVRDHMEQCAKVLQAAINKAS